MKGQKVAVVEKVKQLLPNFNPYKDIALVMLTNHQLELLKREIGDDILAGHIEYSKDNSDYTEVRAYARSMVMNHLKKAKELNGNQIYGVGVLSPTAKQPRVLTTINTEILSEDLKEFVKTLV